ncbi:peroxiredoxin [Dokdonella fugitiva]|uniref:Glutathione-dependent peroxiredoxin n=1 Tax=Dokdonella fugitiva TaxID=328517 RepID=A0A839F299_9GAMM|nr:peroxiredoxin [Dokdonella fugitiva]MBA8887989.1 peroxiredoxin [Dokdonella fugitiva]
MTIKVGDPIPAATLNILKDGVQPITTAEIFGGRKVVLFCVPGAFTPTCSERHLPGFIERYADFHARGIDVACIAVNDAFVMGAWAKAQDVPDGMLMLADGNGDFTRAIGLEMDATKYGMGMRGRRYALYAEDGVVRHIAVEAPGEFKVSSADAVLAALG